AKLISSNWWPDSPIRSCANRHSRNSPPPNPPIAGNHDRLSAVCVNRSVDATVAASSHLPIRQHSRLGRTRHNARNRSHAGNPRLGWPTRSKPSHEPAPPEHAEVQLSATECARAIPAKRRSPMEMIMSTILSASAAAQALAAQSRRRRLIATLRRWWAAYMARRLQLAATRQLKAMSDRELKDIG